jgi:hypothetical protein
MSYQHGAEYKDDGVRYEGSNCDVETDSAIHVIGVISESGEWVPKSCVHDDSEVYEKGGEGTFIVKRWFAEKKGWV